MSGLISTAIVVLGIPGSACSIAAYAEYRFDKFRQRKRRNKMMKANNKGRQV
jgi:hypothetical protein